MKKAIACNYLQTFKRCLAREISQHGNTETKPINWMDQYIKFKVSKSEALLKMHLTSKVFHDCKMLRTPTYSATLLDCIQSGLEHPDGEIGVYAPDADSYKVFSKLFDPLLDYLQDFPPGSEHPPSDFGDNLKIRNLDPHNKYILSTRIRIHRNLDGFPLAPLMTKGHYLQTESAIRNACQELDGQFRGSYFDEASALPYKCRMWMDQHLYGEPTEEMRAANIGRYAPLGRGLFNTVKGKFSVLVNLEDHLRISSMQSGGNIGQVYYRLIDGLEQLEDRLPFATSDKYGFITCNPRNLGTGLRASVHIKLRKLPMNDCLFREILDKHDLQVRGSYSGGNPVFGSVYHISNRFTLGVTEIHSVNNLCNGIAEIIHFENTGHSLRHVELLQ